MSQQNTSILNAASILENLTRTVLYEGYSIFPYNRTAIKNQKPIPFGVIYPKDYSAHNLHTPSAIQTECIVTIEANSTINITVRFLHLITTEVHQQNDKNGIFGYKEGWETIERQVTSGNLLIAELINKKVFPIAFDKIDEDKNLYDENNEIKAKQISSVSQIKGEIIIEASAIENTKNIFRIRVTVINNSQSINAEIISRDEAFRQSFLSTNTILKTTNGEFVSVQNPAENFKPIIEQCKNIGTWPILIDESNTTMLSSPIILYDYPQINSRSKGDLFDSLEIEEALFLHFAAMSDDEKQRIAESDKKLRAMLNKVSKVTPAELINLHGGMYENQQFKK